MAAGCGVGTEVQWPRTAMDSRRRWREAATASSNARRHAESMPFANSSSSRSLTCSESNLESDTVLTAHQPQDVMTYNPCS